jgi:hypothetical protein
MPASPWGGQSPPVAETQVLRDGEVSAQGAGEKRKRSDSADGGSPERGPRPPASMEALPLTPVAVHAPPLANGHGSVGGEDQQGPATTPAGHAA